MLEIRNEKATGSRDAIPRRKSAVAGGGRQDQDAVGNFDGICGVLGPLSPRGTGGGQGSTRESRVAPRDDWELGQAPGEAGSFILRRRCSNHHQSVQSSVALQLGCGAGCGRQGLGRGGRPRVATLGDGCAVWTVGTFLMVHTGGWSSQAWIFFGCHDAVRVGGRSLRGAGSLYRPDARTYLLGLILFRCVQVVSSKRIVFVVF